MCLIVKEEGGCGYIGAFWGRSEDLGGLCVFESCFLAVVRIDGGVEASASW